MTTATPETFKAAWIADLKEQVASISPVTPEEVREFEYQSTDWTYPCIRVAVEFRPSKTYCGPESASIEVEVYSEQKSSKESTNVASKIMEHYHGHPFTQSGIKFSMVRVEKVEKPNRSVPAWVTRVHIECQGVGV